MAEVAGRPQSTGRLTVVDSSKDVQLTRSQAALTVCRRKALRYIFLKCIQNKNSKAIQLELKSCGCRYSLDGILNKNWVLCRLPPPQENELTWQKQTKPTPCQTPCQQKSGLLFQMECGFPNLRQPLSKANEKKYVLGTGSACLPGHRFPTGLF